MSGRKHALAKGQVKASLAVARKAQELELNPDRPVSVAEASQLVRAAVEVTPATQVRKPWRATLRTALQVILGLAPMLPALVDASGVDATAAPVAGALAISAGVARVMALPQVEAFLQRFVPWLAAAPRAQG